MRAWRGKTGELTISKEPIASTQTLLLPCGNCLGCRATRAQQWALRCQLERTQHHAAVMATLTYDDANKPLTLSKRHLQLYLKTIRNRSPTKLRFFASGEYGEKTLRPHYHAIIYGASERQAPELEEAWKLGHVRIDPATPASISYVAGYCSKKIGYKRFPHERVDTNTGEVYTWQPPFIQMSRRPGIGAYARKFTQSWRLFAIKDGHKMPVPRYFKEAWKNNATPEDIETLYNEINHLATQSPITDYNRAALEKLAENNQRQRGEKRHI